MIIDDLKNNKIAILGFGKEGKSTLDFLLKSGVKSEKITVLDEKPLSCPQGMTQGLILSPCQGKEDQKIKVITGESYLDTLCDFNLIFKTPGISPYHEKIKPHREILISGAQLFFDNYKGKIIGITATKGKSTTATLTYETLKNAGYNVKLVGNIGNPVLEEIDLLQDELYDFVIYELSSYMLETMTPKCFIGVLGNLYTCHTDWHNNSFGVYKEAKLNILRNSENILIGHEFKHLLGDIDGAGKHIFSFGLDGDFYYKDKKFFSWGNNVFQDEGILLEGEHNRVNICSVLGICSIIADQDNNFSELISALQLTTQKFSGLPHRLQNIGEYNGITFIDDGISTTPESTVEAIKTYGEKIGTLFLGGADYLFTEESYGLLRNAIFEHKIKNIVLFPVTGNNIFGDFSKNIKMGDVKKELFEGVSMTFFKTNSMNEAVKFAMNMTEKGKFCLMSSAAPSYSLWSGYIEKGSEFKSSIQKNS